MSPSRRPAKKPRSGRPGKPRATPLKGRVQVWLDTHWRVAGDSLRRLTTQPLATAMTCGVIAIALLLPGLLQVMTTNLTAATGGLAQEARIVVYLRSATSEDDGVQLSRDLLSLPAVVAVDYVSQDRALAEFSATTGLGDVLSALPENPLPATLVVTLASADPDLAQALFLELQALPAVELAQLDLTWLQRLAALQSLLARLTAGLWLVFGVAVLLITANTIRLATENRRTELRVVKLVGGTDAFAARPFLYMGMWLGAGGGLLAVLLLLGVVAGLQGPVARLASLYEDSFRLRGIGILGAGMSVLWGAVLGWLGAALATRQQLQVLRAEESNASG